MMKRDCLRGGKLLNKTTVSLEIGCECIYLKQQKTCEKKLFVSHHIIPFRRIYFGIFNFLLYSVENIMKFFHNNSYFISK
jgi:hypothetical protein